VNSTERSQRAGDESRKHRRHLGELAEERTAELVAAIEYLDREITDRRRVEETLREEERFLSDVFASIQDGISILDNELNVVRVNPTMERWYSHMTPLTGKRCYEAYRGRQDPCEGCPSLQTIETGESAYGVVPKVGPGGEIDGWLDLYSFPLFDTETGRIKGVIEYIRDITERKRAEEALRQRNRELALLNRAGQALSSTLDLDRVLVIVLEEVRRLLDVVASSVWLTDLETSELVCWQATGSQSEVVRDWRLVPGEGLVGWVARHGESLIVPDVQADERHFDGVEQRTGLGERSILTVPLRLKQDVIGVLQVMDTKVDRFGTTDLALVEPLAASAAIAIDNARLVEALRQRTVELEARNEDLDAFAHTVAHDLKNPLARIVGFAEALGEEPAALSDEELRRYLYKMARSGRKMSDIIDELLLLAVVRQMEVKMKPLDMAGIVAEAQQRLADMIEERQAEIVLPDTWPVALGYGPWVEEVWVNYLSNALKYGGQPPRVELGATVQSDGAVCFWMRDNGPGLMPEDQARLFNRFTQLGQNRTEGHGLGLSIVQRIVEKLGGQVKVESKVGQGSVFIFTLPGTSVQKGKKS